MIAGVRLAVGSKSVPWAFWAAAGSAAAGGLMPVLLAGTSGRLNGVILPFWVAAAAFAGSALLDERGKALASLLYVIGGLAVVYGILGMVAVTMQMTVLSPCPPAPAACAPGFSRPLTRGENAGLEYAIGLGGLAVLFGFAALMANYRRNRTSTQTQFTPPVRRVPAVAQPMAPAVETTPLEGKRQPEAPPE